MLHQDFTDFSLIEQLCLPELAGCPRASIREIAAIAFSEFCEQTHCYREIIELDTDGSDTTYDLVSPYQDTIIIGVFSVSKDGKDLKPTDYESHSPSTMTFPGINAGKVIITVLLKPVITLQIVPSSILSRWADSISNGVKYRLMILPEKPWSNSQMASYYRNEFESSMLEIASDIRNQFSVSRVGRSSSRHSFYGI